MREQTGKFVERFLVEHPLGTPPVKVLEVGSLDVNGSIRKYFPDYTGVDMREGPNVDKVLNGHELTKVYNAESFDVVISFDTFEHDIRFWETWEEMKKVLKPGGYALIGVPGRICPLHDHPGDYWRFMLESIKDYFFADGWEDLVIEDEPDHETYAWARKAVKHDT